MNGGCAVPKRGYSRSISSLANSITRGELVTPPPGGSRDERARDQPAALIYGPRHIKGHIAQQPETANTGYPVKF